MSQRNKGLFNKYRVYRTEENDVKSHSKHIDCDYFVLDLTHDVHAIPALKAYAESARKDGYEQLADDIETKIELRVQTHL